MLVNNAGVLGLPLVRTADGFEGHMGTNHLGHFALTCLLGDKIRDRVVSVASAMYVFGRIHLDDLNWRTRRYRPQAAYSESKLANLLFIHELARRGVRAYASDPGMTDTGITRNAAGRLPIGDRNPVWRMPHSPAQGAQASVEAVTTTLPRDVSRPAVQPVGPADGHPAASEGRRYRNGPQALETLGRVDRL